MEANEPKGKIPVWNMLRPGNQLGGGFHLTKTQRIPSFVESFLNNLVP
jgi:hypothetical protein